MEENKQISSQKPFFRRAKDFFTDRSRQSTPQKTAVGLLFALAAFLLGGCPLLFDTYPLGMALLCAATENIFFIVIGLFASTFAIPHPTWLLLATIVGTLLIRVAARVFIDLPIRLGGDGRRGELAEHLHGRLFCEGLYLRMATACVSVFAVSLYAIIEGGFRYYDLFGALFTMVVAPLAVFLFTGLFSGEYRKLFTARTAKALAALSQSALAASVCLSLSDVSLGGLPLSPAVGLASVLFLSRRHGFFIGLLSGLACGITLSPSHALILAVAAVTSFPVWELSPTLAASVSCIAGSAASTLLPHGGSVGTVFLPLFFGAAVFATADRALRARPSEPKPICPAEGAVALAHVKEQQARGERIASALDELAAVFTAMSDTQKRPSEIEYRALLDESLAPLCRDCPTARECTAKKRLFEEPCDAFAVDAVTKVEDCPRAEDVREILRKSAARLTREALGVAGPEQFSFDYGISATLLRELSSSLEEAYRENVRLCDAVRRRLADVGYAATSAVVSGGRRKTLTVPGLTPLPPSSRLPYVGRQLELACGFPWEALAVTDGDLTAVQSKTLSVTHGSCLSAKEGVCGDVISVFSDEENGYLYALLDDGMGAGPEAATAAQLGSLFLRRLLPAGVSPETALRMLGQFLRLGHNTRGIEVSTTVDLLSVDLMAGRASFLKSGAAPTYVKRGKNIFYLDSKTAPLGILKEIDAKQIEFDLRPGDLIVMVSDGITDGEKECARLLELLDRADSEDPSRLAEDIVARAAAAEDHDDLSAIVLRIDEAK